MSSYSEMNPGAVSSKSKVMEYKKSDKADKAETPNPDTLLSVSADIFGDKADKLCDYTCRKCDEVPLKPQSLRCGCVFCEKCFDKLKLADQSKPIENCSSCSEPIEKVNGVIIIHAAHVVSGKLKSMEVNCLNAESGCKQKVEFGINGASLKTHLYECKFALVKCPDCSEIFSKSDLEMHRPENKKDSCPDSLHLCSICETHHPLKDLAEHKQSQKHFQESASYVEIIGVVVKKMLAGGVNIEKANIESYCNAHQPQQDLSVNALISARNNISNLLNGDKKEAKSKDNDVDYERLVFIIFDLIDKLATTPNLFEKTSSLTYIINLLTILAKKNNDSLNMKIDAMKSYYDAEFDELKRQIKELKEPAQQDVPDPFQEAPPVANQQPAPVVNQQPAQIA